MLKVMGYASLGLFAFTLSAAAPATSEARQTAQSKSCSLRATREGLRGQDRTTFLSTCMKGSLSPKTPTRLGPETAAAHEITAPSGADRTTRSAQCNTEAARRKLHDSGLQAFRKGCLASASPVSAIETAREPARPTPAKPKLENLTNGQPTPPR
jgi:hypothetical protein